MASTQASKAYVATLLSAVGAAAVAAENGFTLVEILTILGVAIATFQATYWTTNAKSEAQYDGDIDVIAQADGKKTFSLNLNSDPVDLDSKDEVVFKINK